MAGSELNWIFGILINFSAKLKVSASNSATSPSCETLATSLKNHSDNNFLPDWKDKNKNTPTHKATVWQPFPASLASLPNTCFLATAPAPLIVSAWIRAHKSLIIKKLSNIFTKNLKNVCWLQKLFVILRMTKFI